MSHMSKVYLSIEVAKFRDFYSLKYVFMVDTEITIQLHIKRTYVHYMTFNSRNISAIFLLFYFYEFALLRKYRKHAIKLKLRKPHITSLVITPNFVHQLIAIFYSSTPFEITNMLFLRLIFRHVCLYKRLQKILSLCRKNSSILCILPESVKNKPCYNTIHYFSYSILGYLNQILGFWQLYRVSSDLIVL